MRVFLTLTFGALLASPGCGTDDSSSNKTTDVADTAVQVIRTKGRARNLNDLRQLALFYQMFDVERGRPPAEWKELKEYMGRDGAALAHTVDEGELIVVYKVKPRSDVIIAYEKEPSQGAMLLVAMGDASVQRLESAQLQPKLEEQAKSR